MPTQQTRRRVRDEIAALAGFPPEGIREPFKPEELIWTQRFPFGTGGENHSLPPDSIAPDECVYLENLRPTSHGLVMTPGYDNLGSAKASATEILNINFYKELDGTSYLVRIDEDDLMYWDGSNWSSPITGGADAMTGDEDDTIRSAMVLNQLIWVNGVDAPKVWQFGDANYADLTADVNAPSTARHVVAFADRVVFADIGTGASRNTQRVEWSASGDATDFTSLGAGGATLLDTSDEAASDDIMALKVFNEFLVIIRQRSVWVGQRTGEADAPIRFHAAFQGKGAIASDSVQTVGDLGVLFLADDNVYLFNPENRSNIPVGETIKRQIFRNLNADNIERIKSAYDSRTDSYWLYIPRPGDSTVPPNWPSIAFVLEVSRLRSEQRFVWWRRTNTTNKTTCAFSAQISGYGSAFVKKNSYTMFGSTDGNVYYLSESLSTDNGSAIIFYFFSPKFTAGNRYLDWKRINIAYEGTESGSATITEYRDNVSGSGFTVAFSDTNFGNMDSTVESGYWVPVGSYARTVWFQMFGVVGSNEGLILQGYRMAFLPRGEIRTAI